MSDAVEDLLGRVRELEEGIRKHRDAKGDDRCWLDDSELYKLLGDTPADFALPPRDVMLENCRRYIDVRQPADTPISSGPQGRWFTGVEVAEFERLKKQTDANTLSEDEWYALGELLQEARPAPEWLRKAVRGDHEEEE